MKKMPCLFVRDFANGGRTITEEWDPRAAWVRDGEGVATRKWDGSACLVRNGVLFKRYDAKRGKTPPDGWEACGEPDSVTGHHPGWLPVDPGAPNDKWLATMLEEAALLPDGTYEFCGPAVNSNHERLASHVLIRHGDARIVLRDRSFNGIRGYLQDATIEGLVFHHPDGRKAKIRRGDFGLAWPCP